MATRASLRRTAAIPPLAAIILGGATAALPLSKFHAEAPSHDSDNPPSRKPIYDTTPLTIVRPHDDPVPVSSSSSTATTTSSTSSTSSTTDNSTPTRPTPTDRLTSQIRRARLSLHAYTVTAESSLNSNLSHLFSLERSLTSTLSSLAPPPSSTEKLVPSLLYTLVGTMAGSVMTRNRNILLRATVPGALGLGVAWAVMPETMARVGDLVWSVEKEYPVVADAHVRVKERVERFVRTGLAHTEQTVGMLDGKVGEVRESLENWVKRGR